ncbi:MAG: ABC transporter ATP-binding protein [Solirubrobacteraceae bacterium]
MNAPVLRPGEIVLRQATRSFSVRADQARTLKGALIGRRSAGPPPVPALKAVTLHIAPGETVGVVGRNGAGKTSTLRVLAGIVPLQSGFAGCGGRVVSLLELATGFSRDFSGRENIHLQGALYGLGKADVESRVARIIAFSELGEFIDIPVKTYSSGMFVRLGFAIAAHLEADVLLIDEVLAVGDEAFQRKCLRRISEQIAGGTTLVLVSHDPGAIERVCERVVVLDGGQVRFDGPTAEGLLHYHRLMGTEEGPGESLRPEGERAVSVSDVELRDGSGRVASVFRTGAPLQVMIGVRAPASVPDPLLRLELRGQDGTCVFATSTAVALGADGTAQLSFAVPELALLGGDYDLSLGAGPGSGSGGAGGGRDGADQERPALDRTVRFSVPRTTGAEGLVDLRGSWHSATVAGGSR